MSMKSGSANPTCRPCREPRRRCQRCLHVVLDRLEAPLPLSDFLVDAREGHVRSWPCASRARRRPRSEPRRAGTAGAWSPFIAFQAASALNQSSIEERLSRRPAGRPRTAASDGVSPPATAGRRARLRCSTALMSSAYATSVGSATSWSVAGSPVARPPGFCRSRPRSWWSSAIGVRRASRAREQNTGAAWIGRRVRCPRRASGCSASALAQLRILLRSSAPRRTALAYEAPRRQRVRRQGSGSEPIAPLCFARRRALDDARRPLEVPDELDVAAAAASVIKSSVGGPDVPQHHLGARCSAAADRPATPAGDGVAAANSGVKLAVPDVPPRPHLPVPRSRPARRDRACIEHSASLTQKSGSRTTACR